MALRGVEGRVANIVRWLERFERSYSSGAIESALMDAECAKADLDDLRNDVWSRIGSKCGRERRRSRVSVTAFSLAAAAVVLTATPVSIKSDSASEYAHMHADAAVQADASAALSIPSPEPVRQPVAAEVREPAAASPQSGAAQQTVVKTAQPARRSAVRGGTGDRKTDMTAAAAKKGQVGADSAGKPAKLALPYDKILSLFQTGSRALKNDEPVISVNRTKGEKNI